MRIEFERLGNGGTLDWDARGERRERGVRVVLGGGRGCVLRGERVAGAILVPLRGRLQVSDGDGSRTLLPGQLLVVEAGSALQAAGRGTALWMAVFAPTPAWQALVGRADTLAGAHVLLPALHAADLALRRSALRLAREAARGSTRAHTAAVALALRVDELQSAFEPLIARCPGRSDAQRRNVFLRLQRVRNAMAAHCQQDIGIAGFARMASYSPCHFIRAFSLVYGETPHAVLMEHRLGRAHQLVHESGMAITEVARASGFENRCAFARSFKRRYGVSASDLRQGSRAAA
jgi:AraC family transcriptional regulator